jgi:uncharacterized membrane protein
MKANMPEKDPLTYELATYAWVIGLSSFGGIVSYLTGLKKYKFSLLNLIIKIIIGAFVGTVTFFICEAQGIKGPMQAVLISMASVMNTEAIMLFKCAFRAFIEKRMGKLDDNAD